MAIASRSANRDVLHGLGRGRTVCDGGLAKTNADLVEITEIDIGQIGITLPDVIDRLIHPVALIFFCGLEDTATVNVTEQLVTGSI
jgi:hypothetical protein